MGIVNTGFSMSLDGFIAGPNDEVDRLFSWYFTGAPGRTVPSGNEDFKMSAEGADVLEQAGNAAGVLVTARRTFDLAHAWGGRHPMGVPMVVLTYRVPQEWVKPGSPFTFVTDGIESAIRQAKDIAGDKSVAVGAPSAVQQALQAGLIDEINIDLVPVLLGQGIRLFDHMGPHPIELQSRSISEGTGVIHLLYRVMK